MNWRVQVYQSDEDTQEVDSWVIENRTESEAAQEAAATIAVEHPDAEDWTLIPWNTTKND